MSNVMSFVGRVGRDGEVRHIPSGAAVLNVNVAHDVGFGDKKQTIWTDVAVWGKKAEGTLVNYLKKGQQVYVVGELSQQTYKANDGTEKTKLVLNATVLDLVGGKSDNTTPSPPQTPPRQNAPSANRQTATPVDDPYDQDIPF
jgi:single-strand DNA-binding protein